MTRMLLHSSVWTSRTKMSKTLVKQISYSLHQDQSRILKCPEVHISIVHTPHVWMVQNNFSSPIFHPSSNKQLGAFLQLWRAITAIGIWSNGMILASGASGPKFDSWHAPKMPAIFPIDPFAQKDTCVRRYSLNRQTEGRQGHLVLCYDSCFGCERS